MITLSNKAKNDLIALLISCDWDFSRVVIGEDELATDSLNLYIEDKNDRKEDMADMVLLEIPLSEFKHLYNAEFGYFVGSDYERKFIREDILKSILTDLLQESI